MCDIVDSLVYMSGRKRHLISSNEMPFFRYYSKRETEVIEQKKVEIKEFKTIVKENGYELLHQQQKPLQQELEKLTLLCLLRKFYPQHFRTS